jgi:hypothetical protein
MYIIASQCFTHPTAVPTTSTTPARTMVMLDIAYREGQGPAAGAIRLRSAINVRAAELISAGGRVFECQLRGEPVAPELLQELRTALNELQTALTEFEARRAAP